MHLNVSEKCLNIRCSDLPHLLSPGRPGRLSPVEARVIAFLAASYAEHLPSDLLPRLLQLVEVGSC